MQRFLKFTSFLIFGTCTLVSQKHLLAQDWHIDTCNDPNIRLEGKFDEVNVNGHHNCEPVRRQFPLFDLEAAKSDPRVKKIEADVYLFSPSADKTYRCSLIGRNKWDCIAQ